MGITRFTEVGADNFAGGGVLADIPIRSLGNSKFKGMFVDGHEPQYLQITTAAAPEPTRSYWMQTLIGASTPTLTASSRGVMIFQGHNAVTDALGADWVTGDNGNAAREPTAVFAPFGIFTKDATHAYRSINAFEIIIRRGAAGGNWLNHHWMVGMMSPTIGTTLLDVNGGLVETANMAVFHYDFDTDNRTVGLKAAGSGGGVVSATLLPGASTTLDSSFDGKFVRLGIRLYGTDQIEYYMHRKIVAKQTLATGMGGTNLAFGLSVVGGSGAGGNPTLEVMGITMLHTIDPAVMAFTPPSD